jgi:hypothetical protein
MQHVPNYRVIKAAKGECFPSKNKTLTQEYLVEVGLQALMDKRASRIFKAKKCHRYCSGRYFEIIHSHFKNGIAMEAPDTANTSNVHWK